MNRQVFMVDVGAMHPSKVASELTRLIDAFKARYAESAIDPDDYRPDVVEAVLDTLGQAEDWDMVNGKSSEYKKPPRTFMFNFGRSAGHSNAVVKLRDIYNESEPDVAAALTFSGYSSIFHLMNPPMRISKLRGMEEQSARYVFVDRYNQDLSLVAEGEKLILQYFPDVQYIVYLG